MDAVVIGTACQGDLCIVEFPGGWLGSLIVVEAQVDYDDQ